MSAKILVIDDSPPILALTRQVLEAAGYEVLTSDNPILAANEIRRTRPDLVLVDVEMPGLTGSDVVATLKRFDCCPDTPLVLFSSLDEARLTALCVQVGADGWIRKGSPFSGPALVRRVRDFVVNRKPKQLGTALVVDDSRAMRAYLGTILKDLGLEVIEAAHGKDALRRLDQAYAIALVDLNMPEMNGYDFVRLVRQRSEGQRLVILMVTSETDMTQIRTLLDVGADDYLMKPFDREAILDKLRILGVVAA